MSKVITLLLELALSKGQIAIRDDINLFASKEIGGTGSDNILSVLDTLLKETEVSKKDLVRVICTRGPGGYTGIRVALSVVRGLKRSLKIDAHAYPVFDVLLHNSSENCKAAAAIDAGRNKLLVCMAGDVQDKTFFVDLEVLPGFLEERGIQTLMLSAKEYDEIKRSLKNDIIVSPASDNVLNLLFDFHNSGKSRAKNSLSPIYGWEFSGKG